MGATGATAEMKASEYGLRVQAGWCESLAGTLGGNSAPTGAGSSVLASSVAVSTAHARIAAAGVRCTFRMQTTATTLAVASVGYGNNEIGSAAEFRGLGGITVC
jgi:hypothetical protein